jgi:hypothetical protein
MKTSGKINWDYLDKNITLTTYIKLHGLYVNTILLVHDGANIFNLIIGSATPYCQPTTNDGGIGWNYDVCDCLTVLAVGSINLEHNIPIMPFNKIKEKIAV